MIKLLLNNLNSGINEKSYKERVFWSITDIAYFVGK